MILLEGFSYGFHCGMIRFFPFSLCWPAPTGGCSRHTGNHFFHTGGDFCLVDYVVRRELDGGFRIRDLHLPHVLRRGWRAGSEAGSWWVGDELGMGFDVTLHLEGSFRSDGSGDLAPIVSVQFLRRN